MKKITIIMLVGVMFFACVAFAANISAVTVGNESEAINETELFEEITIDSTDKMIEDSTAVYVVNNELTDYLKSCGDRYVITGELERAYKISAEHSVGTSEIAYITNLIKDGYDAGWVMDLYCFWTTCDDDISIIKTMYDACESEGFIGRYWEEDAYNYVTDYSHGVLSVDDVMFYFEKGITEEQIKQANVLSRREGMTIKGILDSVAEGMSIEKISAELNKTTSENSVSEETFASEKLEVYEVSDTTVQKTESNKSKVRSEIIEFIGTERFESLSEYPDNYIYNACVYASANGITPEDVLKADYGTGCYSRILEKAVYIS